MQHQDVTATTNLKSQYTAADSKSIINATDFTGSANRSQQLKSLENKYIQQCTKRHFDKLNMQMDDRVQRQDSYEDGQSNLDMPRTVEV